MATIFIDVLQGNGCVCAITYNASQASLHPIQQRHDTVCNLVLLVASNLTSFSETTLLSHLFWTNSRDIAIDCFGSVLTVIFNYATPFFLKSVLNFHRDTSTNPSQDGSLTSLMGLFETMAPRRAKQNLQTTAGRRTSWPFRCLPVIS